MTFSRHQSSKEDMLTYPPRMTQTMLDFGHSWTVDFGLAIHHENQQFLEDVSEGLATLVLYITFKGTCHFNGTDKQYLNSTFEE